MLSVYQYTYLNVKGQISKTFQPRPWPQWLRVGVSEFSGKSAPTPKTDRIPCTAWLGVDLDEVVYDDKQPGRLIVKLPPIGVSSPKVHHDKEKVLDERRSIWSSPNAVQAIKEKAERKAQAEVSEIALSPDAVKLAKAQTKRLIECFYKQCEPDKEIVVEWMKD